ncbi:MAG: hypothetical protein ACRYE7_00260 [Janthinobacterium lividum]
MKKGHQKNASGVVKQTLAIVQPINNKENNNQEQSYEDWVDVNSIKGKQKKLIHVVNFP